MDIGAGEGQITRKLGQKLGLDQEKAYDLEIDAQCLKPTVIPTDGFISMIYDGKAFPTIPDCPDLVTLVMVLHHTKDDAQAKELLSKINHSMAPGAYLLLREHDAQNKGDVLINRIKHQLNARVVGKTQVAMASSDFNYGSYDHWKGLLEETGFKVVEYLPGEQDNPGRPFYLLLQKKKEV